MAYAAIADLLNSLPATALGSLTSAQQLTALSDASDEADGYLRGRYSLPISQPYPNELVRYVVAMAKYYLMGARGFSPTAGSDESIRMGYEDAIRWLRGVQSKNIHPNITPSGGQSPTYDQPLVISSSVIDCLGRSASTRGW